MIVVDTNVISYFSFLTDFTEEVMVLHGREPNWICPSLWKSEFLNVTASHLRKKKITYTDALEVMERTYLLLKNKEYTVSPYRILELINESNCSSYDCEFVGLAIEQHTKLVTYDKAILEEFPEIAFTPKRYLETLNK